MDLGSLPTTILETDIKLEGTYLIHNSRPTMELRSSTHEVIGRIPPETTHSTLVVGDRLIDIRISSLDGMTTMITGPTTHVLLLVRDEIHRKVNSISPRSLVHLTIRFFDDTRAKILAYLSPTNSASHKPMTNLALIQYDLQLRTIQSMRYPTSAR